MYRGHTRLGGYLYKVEVAEGMDGRVSPKENFPMEVYVLHNWSKSDTEHREILEHLRIPVDLDLLSLGVGHDLSGDVHLVCRVENVEPDIVSNVGKVDFLVRGESESGLE